MKNLPLGLIVLLLLLIITTVFLPALGNNFVNWDDPSYILNNLRIRSLAWNNVLHILTSTHQGGYEPLTELSFAIEYRFCGLNPFCYHLTNLVFHLFNCLLVFWLVFLLDRNPNVAFLAALFFGIHPLRVESVAWVSERKDVLYGFFFLSSLVAYLCYLGKRSARFLYLSLALFAISLLPKVQGLTLPLILLLLDYLQGRKFSRRMLVEKTPFFLISGLLIYINLAGQVQIGRIQKGHLLAVFDNIRYAATGPIFYLSKLLLPIRLSGFYPHLEPLGRTDGIWLWLTPLMATTLALMAIYSARHTRKVIFAGLFFFINLGPVLQLISTGPAAAADRYTYIASIGLCYLVAAAVCKLGTKLSPGGLARISLTLMLTIVLTSWSVLTWRYCRVWRNGPALWENITRLYPDSFRSQVNRGMAYLEQGDYPKVEEAFRMASQIEPDNSLAQNSLAQVLISLNRLEEAVELLERALTLNPGLAEAHNNLGLVCLRRGEPENAAVYFRKALAAKSQYPEALYHLGLTFALRGRPEAAIGLFRQALDLQIDSLEPRRDLIRALIATGDLDQAVHQAREFLRRWPEDSEKHNTLGVVLSQQGHSLQAIAQYQEALRLVPEFPEAYNNLGIEYSQMGEYDQAVWHYREALRIRKEYPEAWSNLGLDLAALGRTEEAIQSYNQALKLDPAFVDARYHLARLLAAADRVEEADFHFREVLRLNPDYPGSIEILPGIEREDNSEH